MPAPEQDAPPGDAPRQEDVVVLNTPPRPPSRRRLTGADLEKSLADWQARRRTRREMKDGGITRRQLLGGVLGLGVAGTTTGLVIGDEIQARSESEDAARIQQLTEDLRARSEGEKTDVAAMLAALLDAASTDAGEVASLQQRFAQLQYEADLNPGRGGTLSPVHEQIVAHRPALAPYFGADLLVLTDEQIAAAQISSFLGVGRIDPRTPWFIAYDGMQTSDPSTVAWGVSSVMPMQDTSGQMTLDEALVVWSYRENSSGAVLAWAQSTYAFDADAGAGRFVSLLVQMTQAGSERQQSAGANQAPPESDQELIDEWTGDAG